MLPANQILDDQLHVWIVSLDADDLTISRAKMILATDELVHIERFRNPSSAVEFILSRACRRAILAQYTGIPPECLAFAHTPNGKPFLAGGSPSIVFNVSHTSGYAAIVVAAAGRPGIDIERLRDIRDLDAVAQFVLAEDEYRDLSRLNRDSRVRAFFEAWVGRESYYKAVGTGLPNDLRSHPFELVPRSGVDRAMLMRVDTSWSLRSFSVADDCVGAVAWDYPCSQIVFLPTISAGDLLQSRGDN